MQIAIQNNNNYDHPICRINGQQIIIKKKSFIVLDTDNEREFSYWMNLKPEVLRKLGLVIYTSDNDIYLLQKGYIKDTTKYVSTSEEQDELVDNKVIESSKTVTEPNFTKESLLNMNKEDLFNICDNFGIKYKKNNSKKTIVDLIIGSGVL